MLARGRKFHFGLCAVAIAAALAHVCACSSAPPPQETTAQKAAIGQFDLAKCETLEPSLYRCPGLDAPLCDPDFERNAVRCVKITKDGVLLQAFPSSAM
ncbi:MAG TPA: hypothetical protein VKB29_06520 [Candidatus Binataceae bacterium]|nr:hypothetical protein [Candidatus Binataceae bacterium]